jgi:hypothetical protein
LTFPEKDVIFKIASETDKAIAQTAAYFLGLDNATENSSSIFIAAHGSFSRKHKELRTLKVVVDKDDAFGPDFSYLRQLILQSRHITVTDEDGKIHSGGKSIDELYSLSHFFQGVWPL